MGLSPYLPTTELPYGPLPDGRLLVPPHHWLIARTTQLADGTTLPPLVFIGGMN